MFPHDYLYKIFKIPRDVLEYAINKLTINEQKILQSMFGKSYNLRFSSSRIVNDYYFSKFNIVINKLKSLLNNVTLYQVMGVSEIKMQEVLNNLESTEQDLIYTIWDQKTLKYIENNPNYLNPSYTKLFNTLTYQLSEFQNKTAISLDELIRLVNLTVNEKVIFSMKYGLQDGTLKTDEEIKSVLNIKDVLACENNGINKIKKFLQEHNYTSLIVTNPALQVLNIKLFNDLDKTLVEEIKAFIQNARHYLNLENYSDKEISIFYISVFKDIYLGYVGRLFDARISEINAIVKSITSENNLTMDKNQLKRMKLVN